MNLTEVAKKSFLWVNYLLKENPMGLVAGAFTPNSETGRFFDFI